MTQSQSKFQHPRTYSPAPWPPKVGELVILLAEPRGFVGVLVSQDADQCQVKLLDSIEVRLFHIEDLISTGLTPDELCKQYQPDAQTLSANLAVERSLPDFSKFKKKTTKKPREQKPLTEFQTQQLKALLIEKIKAVGLKLKET